MNENQNEYVDINAHENYPDSDVHVTIPAMKVTPLKKICMTIGELPSSYLETMTYYEMLVWFIEYLKNTIIPTINNNSEAIQEVQTLVMDLQNYINDFKDSIDQDVEDLETYMNDYFENLDVQNEINNKLDDMAESGQLTDIIAQYLGLAGMIAFDTVADMKQASNLVNGSKCCTLGYREVNDGGKATYTVRNITNEDVVDEKRIIALNDVNLIAELLCTSEVNIKQLGAYGDNTHDDTLAIQTAFNLFDNIYIPTGDYLINDTLNISNYKTIHGDNKNQSVLSLTTDGKIIFGGSWSRLEHLKVLAPSSYNKSCITIQSSESSGHIFNPVINDLIIQGSDHTANGIEITSLNNNGSMNGIINNITFRGLSTGIYFNLTTGWNSGYKVTNCWEFDCIYGMDFSANTRTPSSLIIENYKGQATADVTIALINNLRAGNTTIDNCFIWDGGYTLIIAKESMGTRVYNISNYTNQKYKDLGYHTRILYSDQDDTIGRVKVFEPEFIGKNVSFAEDGSTGSTISTSIKTLSGNRKAGILLSTGNTANNYAKVYLNENILDENTIWKMEWLMNISSLSNVELYVGGDIAQTRIQGNFISLNTANSGDLCGVSKGFDGVEHSEVLIPSTSLNTTSYIKCQITYVSQTECMFFINGQYVATIQSKRYNQQPLIYIKTLDANDKQLFVSDIYCSYYTY